jgi:Ni,Fe-hydrogenase III component G
VGGDADLRAAANASAKTRRERAEKRAEVRNRTLKDAIAERVEERAEQLVTRLLAIAEGGNDADALRAISTLLDRLYGKPRESVTVETEESEAARALRDLTPEQRLALWKQRGLRVVDEQTEEEMT